MKLSLRFSLCTLTSNALNCSNCIFLEYVSTAVGEPLKVLLPSQVPAAVSGQPQLWAKPRHTPTAAQVTGMCPLERCDQGPSHLHAEPVQGPCSTNSAWAAKCAPMSWARFAQVAEGGVHEQPRWHSEHPWKLRHPCSFVIIDSGNWKEQQMPSHQGKCQRRQEWFRIHSHVPKAAGVVLSKRPNFEEIYSTLNLNTLKRKFGPKIICSYGDCKMGF